MWLNSLGITHCTYIGALLAQQKLNYDMPFLSDSDGVNHGFVGNPAIGLGIQ